MTNGPIKAAGEDTGGAYALLDFVVPPEDEAPAPHVHRRTGEAFYVIEGTLKIRLDDERRLATPGSFIFVPPGVVHTFAVEGHVPARFLVILSPPELLDFFRDMYGLPPAARSGGPYDIEIMDQDDGLERF